MCKSWRIDTVGIEFDFPDEEARHRFEKAVELAVKTIDEIFEANEEGEIAEQVLFYMEVMKILSRRVENDFYTLREHVRLLNRGGHKLGG